MHEVVRAGPIGFEVRRLERDDFVGLREVRKLGEDVRLRAAQVDRSELDPDFGRDGPSLLQERRDFRADVRLDGRDERMQLFQAVLERGARHEHDVFGEPAEALHRLRTLRGGVLDGMGFVDGEQVDGGDAFQKASEGSVGGDGHPALPPPLRELIVAVEAVDDDGAELRVLADFALPMDEHAVGRDDEEAFLPLGGQMAHRRQDLDGLAEAHVVAKQDALLVDDVLGAELLVAAQVGRQQAEVEGRRLHGVGDRRRQTATHVRPRQDALGDDLRGQEAFQQRDECRGVTGIPLPDRGGVVGQPLGILDQALGLGLHPAEVLLDGFSGVGELFAGLPREQLLAELCAGAQDD